jgi:pimeloyl-ACP methyl ester carboxylesterase
MPLLFDRPHVIGHSYGGVSAAIAAIRGPARVRSLTLIEPAIFIPDGDPAVDRLRRVGDTVLADGIDTDPVVLREFLNAAGAPVSDDDPLPERVIAGIQRAQGGRPPSEARPELAVLRRAGTPALVASGDHHPAIERVCDAVAAALGAQRVISRGAGHFVPAAPGFATRLQRFLRSAA